MSGRLPQGSSSHGLSSELLLHASHSLHRFPLAGIHSSSNDLCKVRKGTLFELREHLDTIDFHFEGRFASYTASHIGIWQLGEDLLLQFLEARDVSSSPAILNEYLNWLRSSHGSPPIMHLQRLRIKPARKRSEKTSFQIASVYKTCLPQTSGRSSDSGNQTGDATGTARWNCASAAGARAMERKRKR